jgi:crotonobetainyl-CoA:carnitine CoA-transferase CaiB-like acyl-CoA transferase
MTKPRHVLDGYRVLDFTQVLAGPTCTRLLVEMGAEVIKVEIAPKGDFGRGLPFVKDGRSAYHVQQNRGKKSLCVDVKSAEGRALLRELAAEVDVLVENYAPGAIGRMGLGYEDVRALNPKIVMCSISAFGQTGPLSKQPGYDFVAQAYAGVTHMIGDPEGFPVLPMLGLGDVSTGTHAMGAIACALLHRERTGEGQYLDVSILDAYFHCHEVNVQLHSASGGAVSPIRSGHHHPQICPTGIFRGKQGYLIIMAFMDDRWAALCRLMGRAEMIADERYATNARRVENRDEVVAAIEGWLATTESDEAVIAALQEIRVPVAPVLSIAEAMAHPHLRARGTIRTVKDRFFGEIEMPAFPLRFSAFPEPLELEAAMLGEHNAEILGGVLGYPDERIRSLEAAGVIHRDAG